MNRTLDGTIRWQYDAKSVHCAFSADARHVIAAISGGGVIHVEDGILVGTYKNDDTVWDLAMSPSGRWSAPRMLTGRVPVFEGGTLVRTLIVPLWRVNAVDIDDRGEVAVSGLDDEKRAHVLLFDSHGSMSWNCKGTVDFPQLGDKAL